MLVKQFKGNVTFEFLGEWDNDKHYNQMAISDDYDRYVLEYNENKAGEVYSHVELCQGINYDGFAVISTKDATMTFEKYDEDALLCIKGDIGTVWFAFYKDCNNDIKLYKLTEEFKEKV